MLSVIPVGYRGLAHQHHGLCLDLIAYLAAASGWADQVRSNALESPAEFDDSPSSIYTVLNELWRILEGLDAQAAPLERVICISHYLQLLSMIYRTIVQNSLIFRDLRAEATKILHNYQPQTLAERENVIFHFMIIADAWKTGSALDPEGVRLLRSLTHRFPETRRWDTLVITLQKFPWTVPVHVEWEESLRQSLTHD